MEEVQASDAKIDTSFIPSNTTSERTTNNTNNTKNTYTSNDMHIEKQPYNQYLEVFVKALVQFIFHIY